METSTTSPRPKERYQVNRHERREQAQLADERYKDYPRLNCAECDKIVVRFSELQTRCLDCHHKLADIKARKNKKCSRMRRKALDISYRCWKRIRKRIIEEEKACRFCKSDEDLTVDHILPLRKGGTSKRNNLRVLCRKCHEELNRMEQMNDNKT